MRKIPHQRPISLRRLATILGRFEPAECIPVLAALQLVPENVERVLRLEAAALAAAEGVGDSKTRSGYPLRVDDVLNGLGRDKVLSRLASTEDPLPGRVCQEILFTGHGHLVLPGQDPDGVHTFELLARMLYLDPRARDLPGLEAAHDVIQAAMTLSHEVCRGAGIGRDSVLVAGAGGVIVAPEASVLHAAADAVTFDESRLARLLWMRRLTRAGLDALTLDPARAQLNPYHPDDNALHWAPLVRLGAKIVVAAPFALCAAAIRAAVTAIDAAGGRSALRQLFEEAVLLDLSEVTHRLGLDRVGVLADPPPGTRIILTSADEHSAVVFVCVSDTDVDCEKREWDLEHQIAAAIRTVREQVLPLCGPGRVEDLAVLIILQRLSRRAQAVIPEISESSVDIERWLTLEELSVVADAFPREWNRFRYFLEDLRDSEDRSDVMVWSILDILELWRAKGDSLYLGDQYPRDCTAIVLSTESGGSLRRSVGRIVDRHSLEGYRDDTVLEVMRYYPSFEVPIYIPRLLEFPALVVEFEDDSIQWIVVPEPSFELPTPVEPQLLEAVAFWLWRIRFPWPEMLVISLRLGDPEVWHQLLDGDDVETEAELVRTRWTGPNSLELTILPGFASASAADSQAECDMMGCILEALEDAVPNAPTADVRFARDRLKSWTENSNCRMLNTTDGQIELDPRGLSEPLSVQPSLDARVLDELGDHAVQAHLLDARRDSQDQIQQLLFAMVDHLYVRLASEIALFDPVLLETLVVESESQLHATRNSERLLAHSHACFCDVADIIKKHASEIPARSSAAIAVRFLIEYVAAVPPRGQRLASRADLEHLLALAGVLTDYAHEAELAKVGLGPTAAEMLPSGRVGLSRQLDVMDAQHEYLEDVLRIQVEVADHPASPSGPSQADVDVAVHDEFGLDAQDLMDAFGVLSQLASPALASYGRMSEGALVVELASQLGVEHSVAASLVNRLSLDARDDFETPPPGHTTADLWPWRFGRRYSYFSRPLIRLSAPGGSEIVWGPRHCFNSGTMMLLQVSTGSFRGESSEMKRLQGRVNHLKGEEFADQVASMVGTLHGFRIRSRFEGTASLRMPPELGDIDVLAVDLTRGKVWAVECKNFPMTRVPAELKNDLEELRVAVAKQNARAQWLRANLSAFRRSLGVDMTGMEVEPLIVMSALQLSAYVTSPTVPVVHVDEVLGFLARG